MSFSVGEAVSLIQPVIQGQVVDTAYDHDAGMLRHLVEYIDAEGATQQRWFLATQLEGSAQ